MVSEAVLHGDARQTKHNNTNTNNIKKRKHDGHEEHLEPKKRGQGSVAVRKSKRLARLRL